jgi:DNA-binding NarL/FixJ family response regulator
MSDHGDPIDIWLVEDSHIFRRGVVRAIERAADIRCTGEFCAAEDALNAIGGAPVPDVMLLDLGLPGMNGLEAIRAFRRALPQTRIVVLTVFNNDDAIFDAIVAGATGYLLKSGSIDAIVPALRDAVVGGSPLSPTVATRILSLFSSLQKVRRPPADTYGLSPRERNVLELLSEGLPMKEIAAQLDLSLHTVTNHMRSIYRKLSVTTNTAAVSKAIRERLV